MTTISDVARMAKVSVSTVSHVVNGTRLVMDPKRQQVLHAIAALGYVHNAAARTLRTSRSESIGVVVSDTSEPAFAEMIRGIESEARAAGLTLMLTNSAEDPRREAESIAALVSRRVDGLLIARAAGSRIEPLEALRAKGVPVILLDRLADGDWDQVGADNADPVQAVVSHLIECGHQRIALIAGDTRVPTLAERRLGYVRALEAAGLQVDNALILEGPGHVADTQKAVTRLLRRKDRPTALFAASSPMTIGVLSAMRTLGLGTPADLALAHFDGFPHADLFSPGLTSIDQPAFEVGVEAMHLLLRRIGEPDSPRQTRRLAPHITHRQSCGCGDPAATLPIGVTSAQQARVRKTGA